MNLDERLSLAAALYEPCNLGADIGTDHALLPCHLLQRGVCHRMIAADVSPKALQHARENLARYRLTDRASIVLADGLDAVTEKCGCISVMGMGGELMASILRSGQERLQGAVLVLGAHTELNLVRAAIRDVGYRVVQERLCRAAGRFYVFWRAEAGAWQPTEDEIQHGELLWQEDRMLLKEYAAWRLKVWNAQLTGLKSAAVPDEAAIARTQSEADWYRQKLEELTC